MTVTGNDTNPTIAEFAVRDGLQRELVRLCREQGLSSENAFVLRILRAFETPINARDFCSFCGMVYKKTRRWQKFCSLSCRSYYHGRRDPQNVPPSL